MAEGEGCIGRASLVFFILAICMLVLHLTVIYPKLVQLARLRVERFIDYENIRDNYLGSDKIDNVDQKYVDDLNNKFSITPEKLSSDSSLFKKLAKDPKWKDNELLQKIL